MNTTAAFALIVTYVRGLLGNAIIGRAELLKGLRVVGSLMELYILQHIFCSPMEPHCLNFMTQDGFIW